VSQDGDPRMEEAISGLGEPERSILAYLLGRVRELEGEVENLRGGTGAQGGLEDLAERVERLEEAVGVQQGRAARADLADRVGELEEEVEELREGAGGQGGLEGLSDRVDRLEQDVEDLRGDIADARG